MNRMQKVTRNEAKGNHETRSIVWPTIHHQISLDDGFLFAKMYSKIPRAPLIFKKSFIDEL